MTIEPNSNGQPTLTECPFCDYEFEPHERCSYHFASCDGLRADETEPTEQTEPK